MAPYAIPLYDVKSHSQPRSYHPDLVLSVSHLVLLSIYAFSISTLAAASCMRKAHMHYDREYQ